MFKKIIEAEIIENKKIAEGIYRMAVKAPETAADARAGQFVNIYLRNKIMLLPRPISISRVYDDVITLIYKIAGKGTGELSAYLPGEPVRISTSLGNGFQLEDVFKETDSNHNLNKVKIIALVGGGMGVAPLVGLAQKIMNEKEKRSFKDDDLQVIAIVGFQDEPILMKEFETCCNHVYIATESGSTGLKGNVLQLIERKGLKPDYCFACGPKPMLKALANRCENANIPLQVSLEERMGCGYGACVGCACRIKAKEEGAKSIRKKVCTDGPVFFGNEVVWDD